MTKIVDTDPLIARHIDQALKFLFKYASHVDEWWVIKREITKLVRASDRVKLSTRDPVTGEPTNEFEWRLVKNWEQMTGRPVLFKVNVPDWEK